MGEIGSAEWQYQRYDELCYSQAHKREHQVRTIARQAVSAPTTYRGGTVFPILDDRSIMDPDNSTGLIRNGQLIVSLHPYLEGQPEAAVLIAEEIVRAELDPAPVKWHRLEQPEITEREEPAYPAGSLGRRYTIRARFDDLIIEGRHVITSRELRASDDALEYHVKRRLGHWFMRELAKRLGLDQ